MMKQSSEISDQTSSGSEIVGNDLPHSESMNGLARNVEIEHMVSPQKKLQNRMLRLQILLAGGKEGTLSLHISKRKNVLGTI